MADQPNHNVLGPCERKPGEPRVPSVVSYSYPFIATLAGLGVLQHPLQHVVAADKGMVGGTAQVCAYEGK